MILIPASENKRIAPLLGAILVDYISQIFL